MQTLERIIIPQTLGESILINRFANTYKRYINYIPKVGDIFYYAVWWISSAQTGNKIQMSISIRMHEVYWKSGNQNRLMYQRDIFEIDDDIYNIEIGNTLEGGQYKVSAQCIKVGQQQFLYFEDRVHIRQLACKAKILNFQNHDNLIIAKNFKQLLTNIQVFKSALNFNIVNPIQQIFKRRLVKLKQLK